MYRCVTAGITSDGLSSQHVFKTDFTEKDYFTILCNYTLFHEFFSTFFWNKISLPERRNKRKSVLEITKMYYF